MPRDMTDSGQGSWPAPERATLGSIEVHARRKSGECFIPFKFAVTITEINNTTLTQPDIAIQLRIQVLPKAICLHHDG